MRRRRLAALVIAIRYVWLLLFFLIPFVIVLKISLRRKCSSAMPPYTPLLRVARTAELVAVKLQLRQLSVPVRRHLYVSSYLNSLKVAAISTSVPAGRLSDGLCHRARRPTWRNMLLMLVILPFWTSFLLRVYAWIGILKNNGVINNLLMWLGVIREPLTMMHTDFAVYVGIVYSYLPFMILPLYANLEKLDLTLLEAAADLGCRARARLPRITLPLSMPGIIAGSLLVFIPAVGEYVIPRCSAAPIS